MLGKGLWGRTAQDVASGYVAHYVHLDDGDEVGVWVRVRYTVAAGNHELSIRFYHQ